MKNEYIKRGRLCLHAPSIVAQDFDDFLSYWMPKCLWIADELERKKYLTAVYKECQDAMTPVKYKQAGEDVAVDAVVDQQTPTDEKPVVKQRQRKATEKKE